MSTVSNPVPWLLLTTLVLCGSNSSPPVLRVRGVELVDATGAVVGGLHTRADGGVELVLGGTAQASLVTDELGAHLNLVGPDAILRAQATTRGEWHLWSDSDPVEHGHVGPAEAGHRCPHRDAPPPGLDPAR